MSSPRSSARAARNPEKMPPRLDRLSLRGKFLRVLVACLALYGRAGLSNWSDLGNLTDAKSNARSHVHIHRPQQERHTVETLPVNWDSHLTREIPR